MKFTIFAAMVLFFSGHSPLADAQPGRGQGQHSRGSQPVQQQSRHAQQQARPSQQRQAQPARQQPQRAMPMQQHRMQPAMRSSSRSMHSVDHDHGRISNDRYARHFGREHSFHVNRYDYDHRRFRYGGYGFGFVEPWPVGWGYSDDVYVEYTDGGYYMYNRFHPGLRISVNIL